MNPSPPAIRRPGLQCGRRGTDLFTAVMPLGRLRLKGLLGWLFWGVVHVYFLIGLRSRIAVAVNWLWE